MSLKTLISSRTTAIAARRISRYAVVSGRKDVPSDDGKWAIRLQPQVYEGLGQSERGDSKQPRKWQCLHESSATGTTFCDILAIGFIIHEETWREQADDSYGRPVRPQRPTRV